MMVVETLRVSDYLVWEKRQSRIDPTSTIHVEIGLRCPSCKTVGKVIEHGNTYSCSCGLVMHVWGNALECKKG